MENKDKEFFLALAYVSATEHELDPSAFRQKVEEIEGIYRKARPKAEKIGRNGLRKSDIIG